VSVPATPYVSAAAFRAHPTYLDLSGLVPSPNPADQTAELTNLLLNASAWADNECDQPLGAHLYTQFTRVRADRAGMLRIHADHKPVRTVSTLSYGASPTSLTTLTSPQVWVEDEANLVITIAGASAGWTGSLQVGFGASPGAEMFAQLGIVAGYVATQLTAGAATGDTSITVADPTGIEPGGQYRIWEPGREETVTVSPLWQAPGPSTIPAATTVLLADPLASGHEAGHDVSGMPADLREAVVQRTIAGLMRPDTTAEDSYPDAAQSSNTRSADPRKTAGGLVADACRTLTSYGRVR
jgi:hypothetical protein